ncbi:hypothetical protein J4N45_11070 [Vibrio sp. SCSIO 43140]|uniref:hypothetical protein n=1 Tax=Vibrio sp. SCSIO 43140 TaxID=2819100 RepID=UPI0020757212|nr:hypothetical protein [Vibrio sp. SCSIO 43140]USD59072.1 hypothetical protein J4N45_11070 [Vibrio sp. SCSIO 43140]
MSNIVNDETMPFFPIVENLEKTLNSTTDLMALITVIDKSQFLALRKSIIADFQIGDMPDFSGKFGKSVEFGDVSEAVRAVTFSRYPQSTEMDQPIDLDERKEWCSAILEAMDSVASFYHSE